MSVIVIEFVTLDGVVHDPDGSDGSPHGGWMFRYGPQPVAGDKFDLGGLLDTGSLLLGRRTWELFAKIWPGRDDPFSAKLNAMRKLVASSTLTDASGWQNSALLPGDTPLPGSTQPFVGLAAEVGRRKDAEDFVVAGSISVVRTLMAADLVDEYRLLLFPLVLGEGPRLFPEGATPASLNLGQAETSGPLVRLRYTRERG